MFLRVSVDHLMLDYFIKPFKNQQYKAKNTAFSTKFMVIFTTEIRKIGFSRQDTHQIFSFGHFCDPWNTPNQKIWVSYPGNFFSILVPFGVLPCLTLKFSGYQAL